MNKYVLIGVLVLITGAFAGGWYLGRGQKDIQIIEKTGETHVEYRDRIVTVTRVVKPDGTITETTKTEEKTEEKDTKIVDKEKLEKAALAQYLVGASYVASSLSLSKPGLDNVELNGARRLLGPFWINLGIRRDSVAMGVQVEF